MLRRFAEYAWTLIFCTLCALPVVLVTVLAMFIFPVVVPVSRRFHTKITLFIAENVWRVMVWAIEAVGKCRLYFYGTKDVPDGESVLVIANHISLLDWAYVLAVAGRRARLGAMKFFAKNSVKYIPGFGWGIWMMDSIFLSRDWMKDQAHIESTFAVLKERKLPFWLLSFLEGTRATKAKLAESQEYCKKKDLPVLKHVLFPRTKGFVASVKGLRDTVDAIYDITFAPENGKVPSVVDFAMGRMPALHFHIRRFPIKDMPKEDQALADWTIQRFVEKDQLLEHFAKHGSFPDPRGNDQWEYPYKHKPMAIWSM